MSRSVTELQPSDAKLVEGSHGATWRTQTAVRSDGQGTVRELFIELVMDAEFKDGSDWLKIARSAL